MPLKGRTLTRVSHVHVGEIEGAIPVRAIGAEDANRHHPIVIPISRNRNIAVLRKSAGVKAGIRAKGGAAAQDLLITIVEIPFASTATEHAQVVSVKW